MKTQKISNSQSNLEKEKWSCSRLYYKTSHQNNIVSAQKYRSMEQERKPRNKPTHLWSINLQWRQDLSRLLSGKQSVNQFRRGGFNPWVEKIPWRRDRLPSPVFTGFSDGSDSKESAWNAGDLGSIPGSGRSPRRRSWQPIPVFLPGESPMDREAWWATAHGVAKSRT